MYLVQPMMQQLIPKAQNHCNIFATITIRYVTIWGPFVRTYVHKHSNNIFKRTYTHKVNV